MRALRLILLASVLFAVAPARAGDASLDFEGAKAAAAERGVPVLVDFFTDWCVYCKHFDRDLADASTGLAEALESVVFVSIDAEKGEGIELRKKYEVLGFPTYILIDAEGEVVDRWSGYGGVDHFRSSYDRALEDPRPLAVKKKEFDANPTAPLAMRFGEIALGAGHTDEAIALFEQAESLDPTHDASQALLSAHFSTLRRANDFEAFRAKAAELVARENVAPATVVTASQMVGAMAPRYDAPEAELPFLEAALAVVDEHEADLDPGAVAAIRIAGHLKITKDVEAAVAAKKASLGDDWQSDADALNGFAWWCFENGVNLDEARSLASKGVELADSGKQRAMILDTLAEICNALGDCGEALQWIDQALVEAPGDEYYAQQRERFAKILAEQGEE